MQMDNYPVYMQGYFLSEDKMILNINKLEQNNFAAQIIIYNFAARK